MQSRSHYSIPISFYHLAIIDILVGFRLFFWAFAEEDMDDCAQKGHSGEKSDVEGRPATYGVYWLCAFVNKQQNHTDKDDYCPAQGKNKCP